MILGDADPLPVRVDIDEADIPRFLAGCRARGYVRGDTRNDVDLEFVRVEPYVVPKKSLTGSNTERVDTRVLQALYAVRGGKQELFAGQQLGVYVDLKQVSRTTPDVESRSSTTPPAATAPPATRT